MRLPKSLSSSMLMAGLFLCLTFTFYVLSSLQPINPLHGTGMAWAASSGPLTSTRGIDEIYLPLVATAPEHVLIAAAYIDSALSGEPDEAVLLWNVGESAQHLAGWQLATPTRRTTVPLTATLTLAPGQRIWCAAESQAFMASFGMAPACAWQAGAGSGIVQLAGKLSLTNSGGSIQLLDAGGHVVDTLVYGKTDRSAIGWQGVPAQLYTRGAIAAAGQVWQRKLDPITDLPIDSDRATDWAGDLADVAWGRRVRRPGWHGWDRADLAWPVHGMADASVTIAVGPEGLYQPLAAALTAATQTIDLSIYVLEHPELTQILAADARRGVHVRVILEGNPPGGISDLQRWCVEQLAAAGAEVRYLAPVDGAPRAATNRVTVFPMPNLGWLTIIWHWWVPKISPGMPCR